jgi:hypothetical protein
MSHPSSQLACYLLHAGFSLGLVFDPEHMYLEARFNHSRALINDTKNKINSNIFRIIFSAN